MFANNHLAMLRKHISQQAEAIQSELKSDARLRVGVWLILLILTLQPIWFLQDYRLEKTQELDGLLTQEAKIRRTTSENLWQERATLSNQALIDLEKKIPSASSMGIAKATMQSMISALLEEVGAQTSRIDLQDPIETPLAGIYSVSVSVQLRFDEGTLLNILKSLETKEQGLVVERLEISKLQSGRALLFITAYFNLNSKRNDNAATDSH